METLFIACNIFDRYLSIVGHWNFESDKILSLACVSVLLAVKCEEDICPSFVNMINLLSCIERQGMSKESFEELELDILTRFGYEFNYPGPVESMHRFLRLLGLNKEKEIESVCIKILKF